ncbi:MAG: molybdopterin-synthase adenylyltransferase MoeB [Pelolinea sp.]|nr:molybdopterin-synthase adenylyltransferase MoeB [Pelolinea sp.]
MPNTVLNNEEKIRYTRHLNVPEIGKSGQIKLKEASVLIVGAGGLGSASSLYLTAAGIGRIGIADSDIVELSNLQRQIVHSMNFIGKPKVDSAKEHLLEINPLVEIRGIYERITPENINEIVADYPIVIDATDNLETRYLLNAACVRMKKILIYGAVYQFYGQMSVFDGSKGPCFRCVFREIPTEEVIKANRGVGVVSPVPGVIGTLQAIETIKLILNIGTPSIGKLLLFDGLQMQFQEISVRKDNACPVCGKGK